MASRARRRGEETWSGRETNFGTGTGETSHGSPESSKQARTEEEREKKEHGSHQFGVLDLAKVGCFRKRPREEGREERK